MRLIPAIMIIMLVAAPIVLAEELPRHPPFIPKQTITPQGTLLVDNYDLAYISYIAYYQSLYAANITGKKITTLGPIPPLLHSIYESFLANDTQDAQGLLWSLRKLVSVLAAGDLRDLARDYPVKMAACPQEIELKGASVQVFLIPNPYAPPGLQDCLAPQSTIQFYSALDTIVTLLTFNETVRYNGKYIVEAFHIPSFAAYPSVIQSALEGRLGWDVVKLIEQGGLKVNETIIQQLFASIENGSKQEALNALRTLNDYAKRGLISWDTYAKALRLYKEKYGTPILTGQDENTKNKKQVEVNLSSFLTNLQGVVKEAEKARLEYQGGGGGLSAPSIHVPPLTPHTIWVSIIGLLAVAVGVERDKLAPAATLARILFSKPPRNAGARWCYKALILALKLRGFPKEAYETPREYLERIREQVSSNTIALLESITQAYEEEEFADRTGLIDPKTCTGEIRRLVTGGV